MYEFQNLIPIYFQLNGKTLFQRYSLFKPVVIRPTYCDKETNMSQGKNRYSACVREYSCT